MLKKLLGIILPLALLFTALPTVILPQAALAADPVVGTTSLHIAKYDTDGTTILDEETVSYTTMRDTMVVLGDETTHYYMQGPCLDEPSAENPDLWNPAETINLKDKGAVKGTAVSELCDLVGGMVAGDTVKIKALDGYNEEFFYDTVYEPDPKLGAMGISWYTKNIEGTTYPDGAEGAAFLDGMQLVFFTETTNAAGQYVFGNDDMRLTLPESNWHYFDGQPSVNGLSIKQISEILIYTGESGWNIGLSGARSYTMTQGEFESGAACHAATWDDGAGNVYSGIPLWFLTGYVDDAIQHGSGAYNDALADAGYSITITAEDGYFQTFTSAEVKRNNDMILANTMNGNPLGETMYPLRLVGPGLSGGQMVSRIASIELTGIPWLLTVSGWDTEGLFRPDFEAAAETNPASWAQDASNTWDGIALWRLVALVDDGDPTTFNNDAATTGYDVKITATDGYSQTFASADVANNDNMVVANSLNGDPLDETMYPLRLVGPDLTDGQKVGKIATIELIGLPLGYSLNLSGFDTYTMYQPEFEDGAECHTATWTNTANGDVYSGIPLWYLVGYVDDNIQHGTGAFNDELAAAGYTINVKSTVAEPDYVRSFTSALVARNNNILVANKVIVGGTGEPADLATDKYPLYLVGSGLAAGADKVKQITDIELVGLPWGLTLSGARNQYMLQSEFETAAAANPLTYTSEADTWGGLALWRLVALVDDSDPTTFNNTLAGTGYSYDVKITAADNYSRTFTSAEVANNDNMIIANTLNSGVIDADRYPLKLVGPGIMPGAQVAKVVKIELLNMPDAWNLNLTGASTYTMPQSELEDGADCHPVIWDDGAGNVWSGIALWRLIGYVDDGIQHGANSFNDELAATGYTVKVKSVGATSTYERSFTSASIARNNNIIVANKLNGNALDADKYPLYLIGPVGTGGLSANGDKVKQITDIELVGLPAAPVISTTTLPDGAVGPAYSQTLAASGGTEPYTWSLSAGTLPTGLTLNTETGVISGTARTTGTFNFTVQVTDDISGTDTQDLSITITSWVLTLNGITNTTLTQAQFEAMLTAPPAYFDNTDRDDNAQHWTGVPFWRLIALVDGGDPSSFNSALAASGYSVRITTADNWVNSSGNLMNISTIAGVDNMIIANNKDGAPLTGTSFPLKVVGPGLTSGSSQLGAIVKIELVNLPATVQVALTTGWNTFSAPISLYPGYDSLEDILPGGAFDIAYAFDAETQLWVSVTGAYQLQPCEAIYIHMTSPYTATMVINTTLTSPPTQDLMAGWNLVSLANLDPMKASEALLCVAEVTGGDSGYTQVISQGIGEQSGWSYVKGQTIADAGPNGWMQPGRGYWVFMVNDGTLAGFTTTPLLLAD